ncbi:proteinase B [Entomophthora muscae]|uniref:Proteinase B n=1 Tax=Entomophthora muscae TaxID=34485 RepID=A0ACC2RPB3_9FUNG|nr:proteinase B [Entomophthora muscae]
MKFFTLALAAMTAQGFSIANPFKLVESYAKATLFTPDAELIPNHYIVVFKKGASLSTLDKHFTALHSLVADANSFQSDESANNVKHIYTIEGASGYSGKFQDDVIDMIRYSDDVEFVEQDSIVHTNNLEKGAPWGLARVSHKKSFSFGTFNKYLYDERGGSNVTAYVIDTGINWQHEDFQGRASWGATIPDHDEDEDGNGHGSHCAGTVAGFKYGVSKKTRVVAVKVLRSSGSGTMSDVVKGVEWATKAARSEAAEAQRSGRKHLGSVANMSLGGGFSRALNMAVNAAVDSGIHFAVAAGNDDADACDYSPASAEKAVTVGATTINDERAWFSNWGKCVDVLAPGKDITSIWRGSKKATNTISGTSMASPHVAGVLAYLLSLEEAPISPAALKKKLIALATKGMLSDIPSQTPNLLVFTHPPKSGFQ